MYTSASISTVTESPLDLLHSVCIEYRSLTLFKIKQRSLNVSLGLSEKYFNADFILTELELY